MTLALFLPSTVHLKQYTDVQRGTIFLLFLHLLIIFIGIITKIASN